MSASHDAVGKEGQPTLHPASLQMALDAEAEAWALDTDVVDSWLGRMSSDPRTVAKLREIALLAFTEGLYRGACNVIDGKTLAFTVEDVTTRDRPASGTKEDAGRRALATATAEGPAPDSARPGQAGGDSDG